MKLIPLAAAALVVATTAAYAGQGGMAQSGLNNLVTQTTVVNGPYGGDPTATFVAIQKRNLAAMTGRPMRMDRLGYTKLLDQMSGQNNPLAIQNY